MEMNMNAFADVRGYKIDFSTNTVKVNHKFAKAASAFGTPEFWLVETIKAKFPNMRFVEVSGRQNKTCHHDKNLTYQNMETYISIQENAEELMAAYWVARTESAPQTSRYAHVRKWFVGQFPNYREISAFVEQTTTVVSIPAVKEAA